MKRIDAAIDFYKQLLAKLEARGRARAKSHVYLGDLSRYKADLDGAERWYLEALREDSGIGLAHNQLAVVAAQRGKISTAVYRYRHNTHTQTHTTHTHTHTHTKKKKKKKKKTLTLFDLGTCEQWRVPSRSSRPGTMWFFCSRRHAVG